MKCQFGWMGTLYSGAAYDLNTAKGVCASGCSIVPNCSYANLDYKENRATCYLRGKDCGNIEPHQSYHLYEKGGIDYGPGMVITITEKSSFFLLGIVL